MFNTIINYTYTLCFILIFIKLSKQLIFGLNKNLLYKFKFLVCQRFWDLTR